MQSLGYDRYVTQGGDWGSMLTRYTAQTFPDNVKALRELRGPPTCMKLIAFSRSQLLLGCDKQTKWI